MFKLALSFLALATVSACATDDLTGHAEDTNGDLALQVEDVERVEYRPAPMAKQCQGLQDVAATLLGSYQQCSRDADCGVEWVNASCLSGFLCPVAVNVAGDVARLKREADALSFAYQKACTTNCPVASCAAPQKTFCDRATKRCKSSF